MATYISPTITTGTYCRARLVVEHTPDSESNSSSIKAYVQMWRTNSGYTTSGHGKLYMYIDGVDSKWWESDITNSQKITQNSYTQVGGTRSLTIQHNSDGTRSVKFRVYASASVDNITFDEQVFTVTLTPTPVYTLSISQGTGSKIVVNRTSCAGSAETGKLSNGDKLCKGDVLKITFSASEHYALKTKTVNGSSFTSGNTHTVSKNVSVVSTATPTSSSIYATNASVGGYCDITIKRYNASHIHTVEYDIGGTTGTIASKTTDTSIRWTVPTSFFSILKESTYGNCTITCKTYSGSTLLGSSNCVIRITVPSSPPIITASVIDINEKTVALTGDNKILIRYMSSAQCTISATPRNSADIISKNINGESPINNMRTFNNVTESIFFFSATDSRGFSSLEEIKPIMIAYTKLTCNPVLSRSGVSSNSIVMQCTGNYYNGSFGANSNTLRIRFRYKETDASSYTQWTTVQSNKYTIGTKSYSTPSLVSLGDEFDYRKSYVFQIQAIDGTAEHPLTTVTKTIPVSRGVPIFDYGENDFNFNVPVMINRVNIMDIMYPVGSIYMHSSGTMPTNISSIGSWTSVSTGITGVYAWRRTQ